MESKHTEGDDISVCDGTPVIPVSMAGILFCTEKDGMLLLCVDCACLMRFTPLCITSRGPTCGCRLSNAKTTLCHCAICDKDVPQKKTRKHTVLTSEGVRTVQVCKSHWTGYANNDIFMFTLDMLKMICDKNYRVRMSTENTPFFIPRKS